MLGGPSRSFLGLIDALHLSSYINIFATYGFPAQLLALNRFNPARACATIARGIYKQVRLSVDQ